MLRLDHVILAVGDLDSAGDRLLEETGLASLPGGRHAGRGTGNRIVPLGREYVELMGVVDRDEAEANPFGAWFEAMVAEGDRPLAWCLATDDIDGVCARLGLAADPWSRELPDGQVLRWRLAGLDRAMAEPELPFFIQWEIAEELHPGRDEAAHRVVPRGIEWVECGGDAERLREWIDGEELPLRHFEGADGVRSVGVATDGGTIVLGS